jgi:haloalkane dehalogenase
MHYVDEGSGPPAVFVHGNPTWSYFFRSLITGLRGSHRCIAPDHIGCGLSDKPPGNLYGYRLRDRIDDLERLLGHLAPDGLVDLVLHDWGGMIGMGWALRNAHRVRKILLLNTAAFFQPGGQPLPWQIRIVRDTPLGPLLAQGMNLFLLGLVEFCSARPLPPEVRRAYLAPHRTWASRLSILRFVQDIPQKPGDPSYDLAREIEAGLQAFRGTPMLICWGMRDFVFDAGFLAEWQRRFPHAEVHKMQDAHHLVLEDAAERIVPLAQRFLQ